MGTCYLLFLSLILASSCLAQPILETTIYGVQCTSRCGYGSKVYTWCYKLNDWDYCSKSAEVTRYGDVCADDCARRGQSYYWCHLSSNPSQWEYCSVPIHRSFLTTSYYGLYCLDECAQHGASYNWCQTTRGWDYCSPLSSNSQDWTSTDNLCGSAGCYKNGGNYKYCYTRGSNWDYCGQYDDSPTVSTNQATDYICFSPCEENTCSLYDGTTAECDPDDLTTQLLDAECDEPRRRKRQPGNGICRVHDLDTHLRVVWRRSTGAFRPLARQTRANQRDAFYVIGLLSHIPSSAGTIETHGTMRVDLQGITADRRLNIQVQVNGHSSVPSTTAGVLVNSADLGRISPRFVRNALVISLQENCMITLELQRH